jgi:hypothetical protein
MPTNLSPDYAHWAAGAAILLALSCYAAALSSAAAVLFALGAIFECGAWMLVFFHGEDDP